MGCGLSKVLEEWGRKKAEDEQRKQLLQKKGIDFGNERRVGEDELINERNLYGIQDNWFIKQTIVYKTLVLCFQSEKTKHFIDISESEANKNCPIYHYRTILVH